MIVAQNGSGDFTTIGAALASLPNDLKSPVTITIKPGIYKEKLNIETPYITLIGEDPLTTIITYDDYAEKCFEDGSKYGTFNSYTVFVGGHDFTALNLTFENSSGSGTIVGQALALYVDADRATFKNCRFLGHQDTIFTGPLPPTPIIPGSFKGPRENAPRINGRQYFEDCFIKGDVDFIFGSSTAFFYQCEIFSNNRNEIVNGYITAPSTPEGQDYGYIFENCTLTSDAPAGTVYLGRPWRIYGKTIFVNCSMGEHIHPQGFHDWNKQDSHAVSFFAELGSTGPGSTQSGRAKWCHQISQDQSKYYTRQAVLSGHDKWTPWQSL